MAITQADTMEILHQSIPSVTTAVLLHTVVVNSYNVKNVVTLSNNTAASATAEIYLVPESQSPADVYRYLPPTLIPAYSAVDVHIPHDLKAGWMIYAKVSVTNAVTVMYSAKVVS